jgi:hypothetical protein
MIRVVLTAIRNRKEAFQHRASNSSKNLRGDLLIGCVRASRRRVRSGEKSHFLEKMRVRVRREGKATKSAAQKETNSLLGRLQVAANMHMVHVHKIHNAM